MADHRRRCQSVIGIVVKKGSKDKPHAKERNKNQDENMKKYPKLLVERPNLKKIYWGSTRRKSSGKSYLASLM